MVIDLFELLPPDIAAVEYAGLPDGVSRAARRTCEKLEEAGGVGAGNWTAGSPQGVGSTAAGEAASDGTISDEPTVQPAPDRAVAGTGAASNNGPGDKKPWVVATATADTSTDASPGSRRNGVGWRRDGGYDRRYNGHDGHDRYKRHGNRRGQSVAGSIKPVASKRTVVL